MLGNTDGNNVITTDEILVVEDPCYDPKGNSGVLDFRTGGSGCASPQDPRPTGIAASAVGLPPTDSRLDGSATYRGAFEPGATTLWTTPWTAGYLGGILAE